MMQTQLIAAYEQLLKQSQRILECAEQSDWDGIFTLKSQGLIEAAYLRRVEDSTQLDEEGKRRKFELITQILELDGQVKKCLRARQEDLGELMQVNRIKSNLNNAYRVPADNVIPLRPALYQKK